MLHEDGRDPHAVLVERVDLDGLHRRRRTWPSMRRWPLRRDRCRARSRRGRHRSRGRTTLAVTSLRRLVGDPHVDVVRKRFEQLLGQHHGSRVSAHPGTAPARLDRAGYGAIGSPASPGPNTSTDVGRPEPQQQVDVVDDVIAVQVREEDRADRAAALRPALGMHRDA